MFDKIYNIRKASNEEAIKKLKPIFEYNNKNRNNILYIKSIKQYNKFYFQQIMKKRSFYNNNQWKKDFDRSQLFKKNICEYPPITDPYPKNTQFFNKKYQNYFENISFKDLKAFSEPKKLKKISHIQENEKNKEIKENKKIENNNNNNNCKKEKMFDFYRINNINIKNVNIKSVNTTNIDNNNGKKEEVIISLKFIIYNNKSEENGIIVSCKKNDLFSEVVNKLLRIHTNLNKNKIKGFKIRNNNKNIIIDQNKTIECNKLENNTNIIVEM